MVAIVVISILTALLLPAIQGVIGAGKEGSVRSEISQLESAVATFKQKFGVDPPSAIKIYEGAEDTMASGTPPNWAIDTTPEEMALPLRARSRALIQRMWPNYNFSVGQDLNGDGDQEDAFILDASTTLVFFLGGVASNSGTPGATGVPRGFSKNPATPFAVPSSTSEQRDGPYFEFAPSRLRKAPALIPITSDAFHFLQYRDQFENLDGLYLYLSSYEGTGYISTDIPPGVPLGNAYQTSSNGPAHKAKTFQIISPGRDGLYGNNVTFTDPDGSVVYNTSDANNNGLQANSAAYDNLTNFAQGRLKP